MRNIHPLKTLEKQGYEISSWLKVDHNDKVNPQETTSLIREDTILITVTLASNEVGTLEPIKEIGGIACQRNVAGKGKNSSI